MVDRTLLAPFDEIEGEDEEETAELRETAARCLAGIERQSWCKRIIEGYFGLGVGKIVVVCFFEIETEPGDEDTLYWVIAGDIPEAYIIADGFDTPLEALYEYIDAMGDWVAAVRAGESVDDLIEVRVPPTLEWAENLDSRLVFLRDEILPLFEDDNLDDNPSDEETMNDFGKS